MKPDTWDFNRALRGIHQHAGVIGWLVKDLLRGHWRTFAVTTTLSLVGASTRLGAAGIALLYVHARVSGEPVRIAGVRVHIDGSVFNLALWAGAVLTCAAGSAVCIYTSEAMNFSAVRRYVDASVAKVVEGIGRLNGGMRGVQSIHETTYARRLLTRDMNMLLRQLLLICGAVLPIGTVVFSIAAILVMNLWLTAAVLGVLALYAGPFYLLNRTAVRASRRQEEHMSAAAGIVRRVVNATLERTSSASIRRRLSAMYLHSDSARGVTQAFRDLYLTKRRVSLLHEVMFGITVCLVLVVFGVFIARNESSWSELGFYLVSLRYASVSMSQVAGQIVRVNRFSPQIARYAAFSAAVCAQESRADERPRAEAGLELVARGELLPESLAQASLAAGARVLCIGPEPLTLWSAARILERLMGGNRRYAQHLAQGVFVCGRLDTLPNVRMIELLGCERDREEEARAAAEGLFSHMGVMQEFAQLERGWESTMTAEIDGAMSGALRLALSLLPIVNQPHPVVMISLTAALRGGTGAMASLMEWLGERIVLVLTQTAPRELPMNGMTAVVCDEDRVLGIGDGTWYADVRNGPELRAAESAQHLAGLNPHFDDPDDDADDDEML